MCVGFECEYLKMMVGQQMRMVGTGAVVQPRRRGCKTWVPPQKMERTWCRPCEIVRDCKTDGVISYDIFVGCKGRVAGMWGKSVRVSAATYGEVWNTPRDAYLALVRFEFLWRSFCGATTPPVV